MSKQLHIRLTDSVFDELSDYTSSTGQTVQECVSLAVLQMLAKQKNPKTIKSSDFTFIDLFAGIGGMRIAFENAGGHCVYSNEWNKYSQQTYFANFGDHRKVTLPKLMPIQFPTMIFLLPDFPVSRFL